MIDASWEVEKTDPREKFRESLVERAELRLSRAKPVRRGPDEWELPGYEDLGDEYPRYVVRLAGNRYVCTCYGHYGGEARRRRVCSHVLAVILWRKQHRDGFPNAARRGAAWTPQELGLPAKFKEFRPVQVEALKKILATDKRWILLQAPTGSGKTLIAAAAQKLLKRRMLYTCRTKDLQAQFCRDFPYAVELKGRENYPTRFFAERFPEVNCGLCTKTKSDPRCRWCCPPNCYKDAPCLAYGEGRCETGWRTCPYEEQKKAALAAEVAVLNTAMFLSEANYAGGFGGAKFPLVVCDEADLLEAELMSFAELAISPAMIERLDLEPPRYKTKEEAWIEWVKDVALPRVAARLAELEDGCEWGTVSVRELKEKRDLERVKSKLGFFLSQVGGPKWVNCTENHEEGPWVWKPVYVSSLAEKYLWRHGERFLLMSATILEPRTFAKNLGIPEGEWEFIDLPSTFPKENRPVYYIPCANMTHKTAEAEWPKVVEAVDAILDRHPGEKVLVHTVSYSLSRYIAANTRHKGRVIIYDGARDRAEALERFRASGEPLVMLAPSMERGVDLPDDLCVPPGTLVRTPKGYKPIEEIRPGDLVWTHRRRYRKVREVIKRNYDGEMVVIRPYGAPPQMLTPGHPVLVTLWGKRHNFYDRTSGRWICRKPSQKVKLAWVRADQITTEDRLVLPVGGRKLRLKPPGVAHITGHRAYGKKIPQVRQQWDDTPEFWELVGIWAAEGSVVRYLGRKSGPGQKRVHYTVQFSFGASEIDTLAARTCDLIAKVLGNERPQPKVYGSGCSVAIKNDAFGVWLKRNVGSGAKGKRVPLRLLDSGNLENMKAFLKGYAAGDGYVAENGRVSCTSASRDLALGIRDLALMLGYVAQVHKKDVKGVTYWNVEWQDTWHRAVNAGGRYLYARPVEVSRCNYSGPVYNLVVDRDESYSLVGMCVHNCRVVVIVKVPYRSLGDKQVSARLYGSKDGRAWYIVDAIRTLVQMSGRAVRHERDWAKTYILDAQFGLILKEWKRAFPAWWLEALETRPKL